MYIKMIYTSDGKSHPVFVRFNENIPFFNNAQSIENSLIDNAI